MKNFSKDIDDSLRSEYQRSDFGEMARGKYAASKVEVAELVRLLLACIGDDEGMTFIHHLPTDSLSRSSGDWTYEFDDADQLTLRYWLSECGNIEERISRVPPVNTAQDRSDLQNFLLDHVRTLKQRASL